MDQEEEKKLDLSNQQISSLKYYSDITELDISGNCIENLINLPIGLLKLKANNCGIKQIGFYPPYIKEIDISHNKLNIMQFNGNFCTINASYNCIEILQLTGRFCEINVSHNKISDLSSLNLHVKNLDLSFNKISTIPNMENIKECIILNMRGNLIEELVIDYMKIYFYGTENKMLVWDFSDNNIERVTVYQSLWKFMVQNINKVDRQGGKIILNRNKIKVLQFIPWVEVIDYSENPISEICEKNQPFELQKYILYNTNLYNCIDVNLANVIENTWLKDKHPDLYAKLYNKYIMHIIHIQDEVRRIIYRPDGPMMLAGKKNFMHLAGRQTIQ